ncbi:MAG: porin [Cardiobacteriaceae bacterium]|nr:porin [Cardiobacteriaceae bacterium]
MKKLLVAAIAAASFGLVAHAENETTLYGSIAYDAALVKKNDLSGGFQTNYPKKNVSKRNRESADFDTNVVKWGIKGKEEISSDLTALYQLEFNGKSGVGRYAWVALSGASWGTLKIGRQDSLYYLLTNYNDIFNNTFWGSNVYYDEGLRRPDKAIAYVSPNFGGFNFAIVGILNGTRGDIQDNYYDAVKNGVGGVTDSRGFGAGQIGAWYAQNGFFASLVYEYIKSDLHLVGDAGDISLVGLDAGYKGTELIAGTVGYSNDTFKVGANIQHKASDGNKGSLVGEYYFGPNTIRAGFGYASSKDLRRAKSIGMNYNWQAVSGAGTTADPYVYGDVASSTNKKKVYTYALGYQYNFSKRTYTYVEADFIDWNVGDIHSHTGSDTSKAVPTRTQTTKGIEDGYSVRVGLRHDF